MNCRKTKKSGGPRSRERSSPVALFPAAAPALGSLRAGHHPNCARRSAKRWEANIDAPQAPAAPNPAETAAAQTASNKATATTQYELGATNQIAPQGTSSYKQIGTWEDGTPRFEQTTSLNPGEQGIYDTGVQTRQNLGDIGQSQSAKIGALLDTPFDINASRDSKIGDIQKKFLDPQWAEAYNSKKTELFNSGVRPGSEAYDHAMRDFESNKQRGYDQSYLDSYNAANTAALTERNQPINEISALLSGSQVSQPNFGNTPAPGVAPTDYIGAQGQALAQQNVGYQGQLARAMGINSGLFSLGSAAIGGGSRIAAGGMGK